LSEEESLVTIVTEHGSQDVPADSHPDSDALWVTPADLERLLGWTLKPEGLCRGAQCVPLGPTDAGRYLRPDALDIAGLWRRMAKPLRRTADASIWLFGEAAGERTAALESLEAPDFTLPDLAGKPHSLVDYRGRKVLLATWASW
jgi:hypothetical protein